MLDFERAKIQQLTSILGMETHPKMGPGHEKTLNAKENVALAYREIGDQCYAEVHALSEEFFAKSSKRFGKDSLYTSMAKSNLAYIKDTMGNHSEAEKILVQLPDQKRDKGGYEIPRLRFRRSWLAIIPALLVMTPDHHR